MTISKFKLILVLVCPFGDASEECVNVTMDTRMMCYGHMADECCDTCRSLNDTDNPGTL